MEYRVRYLLYYVRPSTESACFASKHFRQLERGARASHVTADDRTAHIRSSGRTPMQTALQKTAMPANEMLETPPWPTREIRARPEVRGPRLWL